jgi:hypothetical protein
MQTAWGGGEESQLSDTALIEQLAIVCQKVHDGSAWLVSRCDILC